MAKGDKPRLIKAPQGLRQRAVNHTTGLELTLTDEVRAKIEQVIDASADTFAKEVLDKLKDMRRQVKAAEDDELQRIFILSNIAEIAFDIKGMGGTFGYPLLSHLAKSLHDFIGKLGLPNEAQLEVISIHIDSMYVVLARGIGGTGGTGGKMEQELLDNLVVAVAKVQD